jgi:hypothetical protein
MPEVLTTVKSVVNDDSVDPYSFAENDVFSRSIDVEEVSVVLLVSMDEEYDDASMETFVASVDSRKR